MVILIIAAIVEVVEVVVQAVVLVIVRVVAPVQEKVVEAGSILGCRNPVVVVNVVVVVSTLELHFEFQRKLFK